MNPKLLFLQFFRKLERVFKKVYRPWLMHRLRKNNANASSKIIAAGGPVVSLTTIGKRLDIVFYTIESIACGRLLPSRITLWLDAELYHSPLPSSLKRLQQRGLEIKPTEDVGPHTKYFPEVLSGEASLPLVTADDDTLYPRYWLERLYREHLHSPEIILCYRARKISFNEVGQVLPYKAWQPCLSTKPCALYFATGVCGTLFPPAMRQALAVKGKEFVSKCLQADDIWLNWIAVNEGIPVKQIVAVNKRFYEVPGTRAYALANRNNGAGENDIQFANTYTPDMLAKLFNLWKGKAGI